MALDVAVLCRTLIFELERFNERDVDDVPAIALGLACDRSQTRRTDRDQPGVDDLDQLAASEAQAERTEWVGREGVPEFFGGHCGPRVPRSGLVSPCRYSPL